MSLPSSPALLCRLLMTYNVVDQLALEKAEVEKERIKVSKNFEEHKALERQQEEDKIKVR